MDRRKFLTSLVAVAGWAALRCASAGQDQTTPSGAALSRADRIARWRERVQSFLKKGLLPIIDTQATYSPEIPTDYMVDQMDRNGVVLVCFAPKFEDPQRGSGLSLKLATEYPGSLGTQGGKFFGKPHCPRLVSFNKPAGDAA